MPQPQTARLGVSVLDYFFSQHGWLFREQSIHDFGIDAHVEIVEAERPTGKLIALQIKSGASFFSEETEQAYIFRTDDKHVAYWIDHSMPVVIVLFHPDKKGAYWQHISRGTAERTGKKWKFLVPKINTFDEPLKTLRNLADLTQPEPYVRRLNRLRVDRRWMDFLAQGHQVRVQFDDWLNKSLPRYAITISTESEKEVWPTLYTPGVGVEGMLQHFFPWANVEVDEDAHREAAEDEWRTACYSWRDPETGTVYCTTPFEEWYKSPAGIVPISDNGETASYSLLLTLNEFGESFLGLDDYLADPDAPEAIGFALE